MSLPQLIVGKRHSRILIVGNINSDATGIDITAISIKLNDSFKQILCDEIADGETSW